MTPKSLGKWCTIALVVGLFLVWGSQAQQQSAWKTQVLAEGPDVSGQRVLTPDIAVVDSTVYVSYVDQATETVWLLISTESGVPESWREVQVTAPGVPVIETRLTASSKMVCVSWQQLGAAGPEVWGRCAKPNNFAWLSNPTLISTPGIPAGQHILPPPFIHTGPWSGSFDIASADDGTIIYTVWAEDYATLRIARSNDGVQWEVCGIPDQSQGSVRYPIIYADFENYIWIGASIPIINPRGIPVWFSSDQCASWKGPANAALNSYRPDYPSMVRLESNIYITYDHIPETLDRSDTYLSICKVTPDGPASCTAARVIDTHSEAPRIVTDSRALHLAVQQIRRSRSGMWSMGLIKYCTSADNGATWRGDIIPGSRGNALHVEDEIFGKTYSLHSISSGNSGKVYIMFAALQEGKSRIMLSTRNTPPTGTPSAVCAP